MSLLIACDLEFTWSGPITIGPLTFEADRSEIIGVFGRSGTGKTTLFRMLAGELRPTNGTLRILAGSSCVYHDQLQKLIPWLSAANNALFGLSDKEINKRSTEIADLFHICGLNGVLERDATRLSGGEKARVALVRSLLESSDILLLDEPFGGVDAFRQDEIISGLPDMLNTRLTFITAHDPEVLARLCDKVLCLRTDKNSVRGVMHHFANPEFVLLSPQERQKSSFYREEVQNLLKVLYE